MAAVYNQTGPADWLSWADELGFSIWIYGCLDGVEGGVLDPLGFDSAAMGGLFAMDVLMIDTQHPWAANGCFGYIDALIGLPIYGGEKPGGGRTLGEDVIRFTMTTFVGTDLYPAVPQDGEFPRTRGQAPIPVWPFLAPAHVDP